MSSVDGLETQPTRLGRVQPASLAQLALLVAAYVVARLGLLHHLSSPVFGWRPADLASIALGYYRHGFRLLYPQVFWGGAGPGYVEMEFPIIPFVTALLLKLFGTHEYVFVVLPLLFGFGLVWLTYRFGSYFFDASTGVAGGFLVALVPVLVTLTVEGQYADPPMVFFASLGLYLFVRWFDEERWPQLIGGIACVSLAALVKLTGLYIGLPIAYLFWLKYRAAAWRALPVWLTGVGTVLPAVLWYWHAHGLYLQYHNTFGIIGSGYSKFATRETLTDPVFYTRTAWRLFLYHLTPLGTAAFAVGLGVIWRRRVTFVLVWLISVGIYTLVAAGGVWIGHFHYLLPLLPVSATVAGVGITWTLDRVRALTNKRSRHLVVAATAFVFVLLAASAAFGGYLFEARDRAGESPKWLKKKITGQRLKSLTRPNSLLFVVDTQMDEVTPDKSMTPPEVFYFADRNGWYVSLAWLSREKILQYRAEGAQYLVVSGQSIADFEQARPDLKAFLASEFRTILDDSDGLAFDLTEKP